MTISMYSASVPQLIRMLNHLNHLLTKAGDHASAKKIEPSVLIQARLFPDMYPLSRQVQIACDMAKGGGARLAGIEAPKFEDNETTFAQLQTRITQTTTFLQALTATQIDGSEEKPISFKIKDRIYEFNGLNYLLQWLLPNVYFHITTAYNILRHNGVELGKADYLRGGF